MTTVRVWSRSKSAAKLRATFWYVFLMIVVSLIYPKFFCSFSFKKSKTSL